MRQTRPEVVLSEAACVFSVPVQLLVTVTSSVSCNIVAIAVEVDVA